MRRLHVLEDFDRMGGEIYYREDKAKYMHDPELREAFEAGCEHGYNKAQEEMGGYSERRMYDDKGRVIHYRHNTWDMDDDDVVYRRRRSPITGRYIR